MVQKKKQTRIVNNNRKHKRILHEKVELRPPQRSGPRRQNKWQLMRQQQLPLPQEQQQIPQQAEEMEESSQPSPDYSILDRPASLERRIISPQDYNALEGFFNNPIMLNVNTNRPPRLIPLIITQNQYDLETMWAKPSFMPYDEEVQFMYFSVLVGFLLYRVYGKQLFWEKCYETDPQDQVFIASFINNIAEAQYGSIPQHTVLIYGMPFLHTMTLYINFLFNGPLAFQRIAGVELTQQFSQLYLASYRALSQQYNSQTIVQ